MFSLNASPYKDLRLFLRAFIANPRGVGAVAPSSPSLARAIAMQVDPTHPGPVLELGPGTGALTEEILARGIHPDRLTVIEYDPELARSFAARFAGVHVINDDAFDIDRVLGEQYSQPFAAIISGIPLLNHPPARRGALMDAAFRRLAPGAPFIQFSYGLHSPVSPSPNLKATLAASVWANFPPARVWVYRKP